jgi:hypothetical protein
VIALVLTGALKPCLGSSSRDASLEREISRAERLILDRLQTERRHVVATGFIWIGKEANDIGESGEKHPIAAAVQVLKTRDRIEIRMLRGMIWFANSSLGWRKWIGMAHVGTQSRRSPAKAL